jgi:hypothetical protein
VEEVSTACDLDSVTEASSSPVTSSIQQGATDHSSVGVLQTSTQNLDELPTSSPLLFLMVIPAVVIGAVIVIVVSLLAWRYRNRESIPVVCKSSYKAYQVFVFYCSTTPQKEVTHIQQHIVCPLLEYFEVVTLSDHVSGDLPVWIEKTIQTSKSVLLVSNQEFYSQWSKMDEQETHDPAINCLSYIISAAVSSHALDKFSFVIMKDSAEKNCVPVNSYLENFPVFTLSRSSSKNKQEMEKIYHFVTRIPKFQFSSTGSTPTTEGPVHLAMCPTE